MRTFSHDIPVRGYELDSFNHVNHAVFLSYFEHARWEALWAGGLSPERFMTREMGVYIVRVEADFTAEARLGDVLRIDTTVEEFRNTSMTIVQTARRMRDDVVAATLRAVAVWVNRDGRPTRVPPEARAALE